jgi:hypothetical protein
MELLESRYSEPEFPRCTRRFMKACGLLLLDDIPPEAKFWMNCADAFEADLLTHAEVARVRSEAWKLYDDLRDSWSQAELSALRVAMYRLWPHDGRERWFECVHHFLNFCVEAGLQEADLDRILRECFAAVLMPTRE